jgi:uncharacterized protein (DUF58 family)
MKRIFQPGFLGKLDRQAWVRFFIALGGLSLAMTAAMYSTLFQREGNLLATGIAASVALLTAGWVGLYTVPFLAKRAALEGMREAFDYDVTTEGLVYLGTALLVGVAALNTGNNMLFIIVAAMLSAIAVSGAASAVVLRALRLEVTLPAHVFANDPVMARVVLRNRFYVSSFSVSVVPPRERKAQGWHWERGEFVWPPKRAAGKEWVRLKDWKLRPGKTNPSADAIFRGAVYFPYIAARQSAFADLELNFPRRGRYVQDGFGLATRFPFSFLIKTRRVAANQELIAYPSVQPTDEFFSVLPMITGEFEAFVRGRGYDLYRIREHMPEDSARLVDWKATAKSGALKVREFTREDERKLRIVFDNAWPGAVSEHDYEAAVALTASLSWHFAATNTQLTFVAQGYSGSSNVLDFLRYLALVKAQEEAEPLLSRLKATGDYNVIVTAQPRGSVPTELWATSYIVFIDKNK